MGSSLHAVTQPTRKRLGVAILWRRVSRPGRPTEVVSGPASLSDDKQQVDRSCDGHTAAQSRLSPAPATHCARSSRSWGSTGSSSSSGMSWTRPPAAVGLQTSSQQQSKVGQNAYTEQAMLSKCLSCIHQQGSQPSQCCDYICEKH